MDENQKESESQNQIPPNKKWSKKRWVLVIFLVAMVPVQFLNNTGFCYSEMRYVPERELVDRFLFGLNWSKMSDEEKSKKIEENKEGYESCCKVDGEAWWLKKDKTYLLGKILTGQYRYGISYYHPRNPEEEGDSEYPYYVSYVSISSCGSNPYPNHGTTVTEHDFQNYTQQIKNYWKKMENRQ